MADECPKCGMLTRGDFGTCRCDEEVKDGESSNDDK